MNETNEQPSAPSAGAGTPDNQYQRTLKRLLAGESYSDATQSKIEPAAPDAGPTPLDTCLEKLACQPLMNLSLSEWSEFVNVVRGQQTELAEARAELARKTNEIENLRKPMIAKLRDRAEAADQEVGLLRGQVAAAVALLGVAKCPETNCDGNGSSWYVTCDHRTGEPEQVQMQCQWCSERTAFLAELKGEKL